MTELLERADVAEQTFAAPATDGAKLLMETRRTLGKFISASDSQLWAITFWVFHTYVLDKFRATPRLLLTSKDGGCGKTETLLRIMSLSQNGWRGKGSKEAIKAKFGEADRPTIVVDEVSQIFGKSGRGGSTHPLAGVLCEGYKRGATDSFSVNRVAEEISIYAAVALAGRGNAVPDDIRSRCIVVKMQQGRPAEEYEFEEHDRQFEMLGQAIGQWVKKNAAEIGAFRARPTLHPRMIGRVREIWQPLLAVASAAGPEMLRVALSACLDLAMDEAEQAVLTPMQTILRDMARAAGILDGNDGSVADGFALGADLREEMREFGEPMYETMPDRALSMLMAEAVPEDGQRIGVVGNRRGRGYVLAAIRREWSQQAPARSVAEISETDLPDPDEVEVIE